MPLLAEVTRRAITLGTRDAVTGWRKITHTTSTIDMVTTPKGSTAHVGPFGVYAYMDLAGIGIDPTEVFDQIILQDSRVFLVQTVMPDYVLDSLQCRRTQMSELPLWQANPSSTATWKTSPSDARSRTKVWITTYILDTNILKDDAVTEADWACLFANPPYPTYQEFRATTDPVEGLFIVSQPVMKPLMDATTQSPYGYEETVPIRIVTVDSIACSGDTLNWRMETELRRIAETYAVPDTTGSQRGIERRSSKVESFGGFPVYVTEVELKYRRLKTT